MTQPPYYGTPQDPYNPQPPQQYPPAGYQQVPNGYAPAPQGYQPAPQYGPPPGQYPGQQNPQHQAQQEYQGPVGATGTLGDFHKQRSSGGATGISWDKKPDGYRYVLVVSRTPVDADLFHDRDPKTKQLKNWPDGSPKFVLPVQCLITPVDQWQAQEYNDGEAAFYLRGALRDECNRAMAEAGRPAGSVPEQGDLFVITLTHRKPGRGTIPANQFSVIYRPAGSWETDPQYAGVVRSAQPSAPHPAPYQQQAPAQYAAPVQAAPNPQQYAQPQYGAAPAYDPNQYQQAPQGQYSSQAQAAPVQYAPNPPQAYQEASGNAGAHPQYAVPNAQQAPVQAALPGMPPTPPQAPPSAGAVGAPDPHKAALIAQLQGAAQQQAPNPQQ